MRWWAAGRIVPVVVVLAACGTSPGGGSDGGASESRSTEPPRTAPTSSSASPASPAPGSPNSTRAASPAGPSPSAPAVSSSAPAAACVAGRTEVSIAPGDAPRRQLCVRPGTVVSLVLQARKDDKRWTAVRSSAPVLVLVSGWRVDADGTAHASLRSAGARGGGARITALAKAPDVAGAARVAFTLDMTVTPQTREG